VDGRRGAPREQSPHVAGTQMGRVRPGRVRPESVIRLLLSHARLVSVAVVELSGRRVVQRLQAQCNVRGAVQDSGGSLARRLGLPRSYVTSNPAKPTAASRRSASVPGSSHHRQKTALVPQLLPVRQPPIVEPPSMAANHSRLWLAVC
jgi:hypothetical protein